MLSELGQTPWGIMGDGDHGGIAWRHSVAMRGKNASHSGLNSTVRVLSATTDKCFGTRIENALISLVHGRAEYNH